MTGTHTQNPVYSRLTLALMEDTGWYRANYSLAQDLSWGKNLGCDFVTKSCKHWMDTKHAKGQSIHPFCNKVKRDPLETECTDDRSSVALCNLVEHGQPLPNFYQVSAGPCVFTGIENNPRTTVIRKRVVGSSSLFITRVHR